MKTAIVGIINKLKGHLTSKYTRKEAEDVEDVLEGLYGTGGTGVEGLDAPPEGPQGDFPFREGEDGEEGTRGDGPIGGIERVLLPPRGGKSRKGQKGSKPLPEDFGKPPKYIKDGKDLIRAISEAEKRLREKEKREESDFRPVPEWNREKRGYEHNKVGYVVEAYSERKDEGGLKTYKEKFSRLSDLVKEELKKLKPTARRRVTRQTEGSLDMEVVIRELKKGMSGKDISDKLYERTKKERRDYAVGILIDRSGSTSDGVGKGFDRLDVEKYSAMLLADALDELNDNFAVYSFSTDGSGTKTSLEKLKEFDDEWDEPAKQYVASITPGHQNHDGTAIRGMTEMLAKRTEKKKVLVHISDGTPWVDGGYYRREYANEDTLKAIEEAEKAGIRVIYLSIDPSNLEFFRQAAEKCTFAEKFNDVFELPKKITDLYLAMRK
ncbi:nitric oxide reductase activation protein NorD [Candidatus Woesearchaeota archaeon]|nr:nitric oxide reductase activation protein NorD [Candidatus Woesearchaeota archaeon]